MDLNEDREIICPYCGEPTMVEVETASGDFETIEDCSVCCRPIRIEVRCRPGDVASVAVERG